jgi:predicted choloylglycine hydrolase
MQNPQKLPKAFMSFFSKLECIPLSQVVMLLSKSQNHASMFISPSHAPLTHS